MQMMIFVFSCFSTAHFEDPNNKAVPDLQILPDPSQPGKLSCPVDGCWEARDTADEVLRHHYVAHNVDPCAECGEQLHPLHMAKHVQFMHKAPKYKCKHCDKSFRYYNISNYFHARRKMPEKKEKFQFLI